MRIQVTPSDNAGAPSRARARQIAALLRGHYRRRREVDWSEPVLVVGTGGLRVRHEGRELCWNPGLLHTRLEAGAKHPLVRAIGASEGPVLDTTLGLGTDATFLARWFGCKVIGLEASPILALLAAAGLRGAGEGGVHVVCAESGAWLAGAPARSVGVVYADPLFDEAGTGSTLALVRLLGSRASVDHEWLALARRVARERVVVKDSARGDLLEKLRPERIERSKTTRFGIWSAA